MLRTQLQQMYAWDYLAAVEFLVESAVHYMHEKRSGASVARLTMAGDRILFAAQAALGVQAGHRHFLEAPAHALVPVALLTKDQDLLDACAALCELQIGDPGLSAEETAAAIDGALRHLYEVAVPIAAGRPDRCWKCEGKIEIAYPTCAACPRCGAARVPY